MSLCATAHRVEAPIQRRQGPEHCHLRIRPPGTPAGCDPEAPTRGGQVFNPFDWPGCREEHWPQYRWESWREPLNGSEWENLGNRIGRSIAVGDSRSRADQQAPQPCQMQKPFQEAKGPRLQFGSQRTVGQTEIRGRPQPATVFMLSRRCLRLRKNSYPSRQRRTKMSLSSSIVLMIRRIGFGRR